jgi:hypothetical protein
LKKLTPQQADTYRHNGYLFPLPALAAEEAAEYLALLGSIEAHIGSPLSRKDNGLWRSSPHLYLPAFDRLVRDPRIVDAVEDLLGPDLLVYTGTFFIKEAGSPTFAAWHQDATYFGIRPHDHVTAWVALSDAGTVAGCMEVLSSRGEPRQLHHAAARLEHSINGAGQTIVERIDETGAVPMALKAGEFSMHHTLCVHRSAPNAAAHRRVGFGISYIPTRCKLEGAYRLGAMLVRGEDRFGHFDLMPRPEAPFAPDALARHAAGYQRYREHYREEEQRHEALFA